MGGTFWPDVSPLIFCGAFKLKDATNKLSMYSPFPSSVAFQCEYNEDETLASYAKRNYDFYDAELIEKFVAFKGALKLLIFLKILMMPLTNLRALLYFSIALKIRMTIIILLIILRELSPKRRD